MRLNINQNIKVKLRESGLKELERQHDGFSSSIKSSVSFNPPLVDKDGYSTFQLWDLMSTFGHMIDLGSALPFDAEMIIKD